MASSYFDLCADIVRAHARMLQDSPQRTAPPRYHGRAWGELSDREQLDVMDGLTRCNRDYHAALTEALPECARYNEWCALILDSNVSDAEIGRQAREIVRDYFETVAAHRGDELMEEAL